MKLKKIKEIEKLFNDKVVGDWYSDNTTTPTHIQIRILNIESNVSSVQKEILELLKKKTMKYYSTTYTVLC